ncbi:MAG: 50S ribosomal protein L13 [Candidatus Auribacterota bacterium]|jgi:large subunit ribosomal protein L13|uniref:Large ribosomal subunit protein uL13 n=1 Tax=Candidatus Auribacter fodinae TaxID=2093366 RepID=A0A3A4QW18_9BACT|nr:MAG: 50S ribosomal protein L13 [Candidatus Auribacter fodinae]
MKTYSTKPADIERKWYIIDAKGLILGRLASKVAVMLRGKHKPVYSPSVDAGDYIVVINADKVRMTGKKTEQKTYQHFTGYPGGLRVESYKRMQSRKPEYVIQHAVAGMLPHNKLGRAMIKKLKIFAGTEHAHVAQQPESITV